VLLGPPEPPGPPGAPTPPGEEDEAAEIPRPTLWLAYTVPALSRKTFKTLPAPSPLLVELRLVNVAPPSVEIPTVVPAAA
jgi:hypothetical protein